MSTTLDQDLEALKTRADLLGVKYPSKITAPALREMIRDHQDKLEEKQPASRDELLSLARKQVHDDAMKLIRVRITNMNPKKKDLKGELLTVANEFIGTVTKFIPFDPEFSINGYHIPNVIYENMLERKFLHIRTVKDRATGKPRITESWAKEYAIEVLPPLTEKELRELATAQQASGSIDQTNAV